MGGQGTQLKQEGSAAQLLPHRASQEAREAGGQQLWFHGCEPVPQRGAKHKPSHTRMQK